MFGSWAATHPNPVVSDELWAFVHSVKQVSLLEDETRSA
jgi:hypothetical protein